jgi:hypothetical protein
MLIKWFVKASTMTKMISMIIVIASAKSTRRSYPNVIEISILRWIAPTPTAIREVVIILIPSAILGPLECCDTD